MSNQMTQILQQCSCPLKFLHLDVLLICIARSTHLTWTFSLLH